MSKTALTSSDFLDTPLALRRHLTPCAHGESVYLIGASERHLLRGRLYLALVPHLVAPTTPRSLVATLAQKLSAAEVFYALERLLASGYVRPEDSHGLQPDAAHWDLLRAAPAEVRTRLAGARIETRALDGLDPSFIHEAFASPSSEPDHEHALDLLVVVAPDLSHPDLAGIDANARARGRTWVIVVLEGPRPSVGPVFVPEHGPCWHCLAHRLDHNRPVLRYLDQAGLDLSAVRGGSSAGTRALARGLAIHQLEDWIARGESARIHTSLAAFNCERQTIEFHHVVRRPQCPACGEPSRYPDHTRTPVLLGTRAKAFTATGAHRVDTPEQTFARLAHHISPVTGLVQRANAIDLDHDRPLEVIEFPSSPREPDPAHDVFFAVGGGKGRTRSQARASALGEALERLSAIYSDERPRRRASAAELGDDAIDLNALQLFSDAQLSGRDIVEQPAYDPIPPPFDRQREIDWTACWSLTHERVRWVPSSYCYRYCPSDQTVCTFNSNGHAAGNVIEEAILHGLLELIERDAVAIWWYNRAHRPVSAPEIDEPYLGLMRERYAAEGWDLWTLDLTHDFGVPVVTSIAQHRSESSRFLIGFGCHLEARLALQRSLTELNQISHSLQVQWRRSLSTIERVPHLIPHSVTRTAARLEASNDLLVDVRACVDRAAELGMETLVLDQSQPDLELEVVKVMVPGMRHFLRRLAPGRLYEVPVALGWLEQPLREQELNTTPIFW